MLRIDFKRQIRFAVFVRSNGSAANFWTDNFSTHFSERCGRRMPCCRWISLVAVFIGSALGLPPSASRCAYAANDVLDQVTQIFAAVDGPTEKQVSAEVRYAQLLKLKPGETANDAARYAYLVALV